MFWWNKENPAALFMDCREVEKGAFQNNWNPGWCVRAGRDCRLSDMPFPDNVFKMVVFDPPHLTSGSMKNVINKNTGFEQRDMEGRHRCWFFGVLASAGHLAGFDF